MMFVGLQALTLPLSFCTRRAALTISTKLPRLLLLQRRSYSFHHLQDDIKKCISLSRLMVPDDGNFLGIVHGGVILQLCDDAASIVTARYVNCSPEAKEKASGNPDDTAVPTLARISNLEFVKPLRVSEVAEVNAEVKYTSEHSLLVHVEVRAEDILKGNSRNISTTAMWYVPVTLSEGIHLKNVPPMKYSDTAERELCEAEYLSLRNERSVVLLHPIFDKPQASVEHYTVGFATTTLAKQVSPSDVNEHGDCKGGVILKLMDECADIVAAKHCGRVAVTRMLDAINFNKRVRRGAVLTVSGRPTFTSEHTVEVQVVVDAEYPFEGTWTKYRVVEAYFVEMPLDEKGRPVKVPELLVQPKEEKRRFHAGQERYEFRRLKKSEENSLKFKVNKQCDLYPPPKTSSPEQTI